MAEVKGKYFKGGADFGFSLNYNTAVPVDTRTVVKTLDDLYSSSGTWEINGVSTLYRGLVVSVLDEGTAYMYNGIENSATEVAKPENWVKMSTSSSLDDVAKSVASYRITSEDSSTAGILKDYILNKTSTVKVEEADTTLVTAITSEGDNPVTTYYKTALLNGGNLWAVDDVYGGVSLTEEEAAAKNAAAKITGDTVEQVEEVGRINIPKDFLVKKASIVSGTWDDGTFTKDAPDAETPGTGKAIEFVLNTKDGNDETGSENPDYLYINLKDLIDVISAGAGIQISDNNEISVLHDESLKMVNSAADEEDENLNKLAVNFKVSADSEDYVAYVDDANAAGGKEIQIKTTALGDAAGLTKMYKTETGDPITEADYALLTDTEKADYKVVWVYADGELGDNPGLAMAKDVADEILADEKVIAAALNDHESRLNAIVSDNDWTEY